MDFDASFDGKVLPLNLARSFAA